MWHQVEAWNPIYLLKVRMSYANYGSNTVRNIRTYYFEHASTYVLLFYFTSVNARFVTGTLHVSNHDWIYAKCPSYYSQSALRHNSFHYHYMYEYSTRASVYTKTYRAACMHHRLPPRSRSRESRRPRSSRSNPRLRSRSRLPPSLRSLSLLPKPPRSRCLTSEDLDLSLSRSRPLRSSPRSSLPLSNPRSPLSRSRSRPLPPNPPPPPPPPNHRPPPPVDPPSLCIRSNLSLSLFRSRSLMRSCSILCAASGPPGSPMCFTPVCGLRKPFTLPSSHGGTFSFSGCREVVLYRSSMYF